MWNKIVLAEFEIALIFKDKELIKVLTAEKSRVHRLPVWSFDQMQVINTENGVFEAPALEKLGVNFKALTQHKLLAPLLNKVELTRWQVGLMFQDKELWRVLAPGKTHFLWTSLASTGLENVRFESREIGDSARVSQTDFDELNNPERSIVGAGIAKVKVYNLPKLSLAVVSENGHVLDVIDDAQFALWHFNRKLDVTVVDAKGVLTALKEQRDRWLKSELVRTQVLEINTEDMQVVQVFSEGKLQHIVAPNSELELWTAFTDWQVKTIDISEQFELSAAQYRALRTTHVPAGLVTSVHVAENEVASLSIDGVFNRLLTAGEYYFWQAGRNIQVQVFDQRWLALEIAGQEILSKDRVSLRVNLSANYRVVDVHKLRAQVQDEEQFVYRHLQLALREAVGTRLLDELLQDKSIVNREIIAYSQSKLAELGIELGQIGIKDIILPGEMKDILNQVVNAQKQAEANSIKRREETAQTRSLHNTAKVMEGNQTLMRLKELETLERIAERIDNFNVYGGLDQVMNGLVKLDGRAG